MSRPQYGVRDKLCVYDSQAGKQTGNRSHLDIHVDVTAAASVAAAIEEEGTAPAAAVSAVEQIEVPLGSPDVAIRLGLTEQQPTTRQLKDDVTLLPEWSHVEGSLESGIVSGGYTMRCW